MGRGGDIDMSADLFSPSKEEMASLAAKEAARAKKFRRQRLNEAFSSRHRGEKKYQEALYDAWRSGIPEVTLVKGSGFSLEKVRDLLEEAIRAEERYQEALSASRHASC